jgi:hypothetical protein
MIKTYNKLTIAGNCLNIIQTVCEKSTVNIILNGENLKVFPLKFGEWAKMATLITSIQHSIGCPSQSN